MRTLRITAVILTILMTIMTAAPYTELACDVYAQDAEAVTAETESEAAADDSEAAEEIIEDNEVPLTDPDALTGVDTEEAANQTAADADSEATQEDVNADTSSEANSDEEQAEEPASVKRALKAAAAPAGAARLRSSGKVYQTFDAAYNAAKSGDTIELLKDIELSSSFKPQKAITITTAAEYDGKGNAVINRGSGNSSEPMFVLNSTDAKLTLTDVTIDGKDVEVTDDGGLFKVKEGTLILESGAVLQHGHAAMRGGAIYVTGENSHVLMKDGSIIQNCQADRRLYYAGGAVCAYRINYGDYSKNPDGFHMSGGIIRDCDAKNGSGGAIGVNHHDTIHISGGLITDCSATNRGGAIEAHGTVDMSGGTITNCHSQNGGAINFFQDGNDYNDANDGDEAIIIFSGSPKIYGNYNDKKPTEPCNVDIYQHYTGDDTTYSNIRIRTTTEPLNGDAFIGVYAGEYVDNGRFGIYRNGSNLSHLECFTNDRDSSLVGSNGGAQDFGSSAGKKNNGILVWGRGIKTVARMYTDNPNDYVEIAGSEGKYLFDYGITQNGTATKTANAGGYADLYIKFKGFSPLPDAEPVFSFARYQEEGKPETTSSNLQNVRSTVKISGSGRGKTYSYKNEYSLKSDPINTYHDLKYGDTIILYYKVSPICKITDATGKLLQLQTGNPAIFGTVEGAFSYADKMFANDVEGNLVSIKNTDRDLRMLVPEYTQKSAITAEGAYNLRLTTESREPVDGKFPGKGESCVITRASSVGNKPTITDSLTGSTGLVLDDITLDGADSKVSVNGAAVRVAGSGAKLTMINESLIKNFGTSSNGGAVYPENGASFTMQDRSALTNCKGTKDEAVYLPEGSQFIVSGSPSIDSPVVLASNQNVSEELILGGDLNTDIDVYPLNEIHSTDGRQFAVTDSTAYTGCEHFINHNNELLHGVYSKVGGDKHIYWGMSTGDLTISQNVDGSYGDVVREFTYNISLPDKNGEDYTAVKYVSLDGRDDVEKDTLTLKSGSNEISLAHGEYIVISDVLLDKDIKLQATGRDIGSGDGNNGIYMVSYDCGNSDSCKLLNLGDDDDSLTTVSFMMKDDVSVAVTDTLNSIPVNSGISGEVNPLLFVLLILLFSLEGCIIHRRRLVKRASRR